ncbi:hypothetical protein [Streptomyces sp. TLI_171]|uniref:hypothetical protein n=1 Tax=Streptomyces sp. TLI_171 TaxID=1938859 RepID=UPI00117D30C6|nr:hypothetical protein [Streptomyces sp. TLI_171]
MDRPTGARIVADHSPPRYGTDATGPVEYCPVVSTGFGLRGYLWFSDAEGAAWFVELRRLDRFSGSGHWSDLLKAARAGELTPSRAVELFAEQPEDPYYGLPDLSARATADSVEAVKELGLEGWVPPKEPIVPRGHRPYPGDAGRLTEAVDGWRFEVDEGYDPRGPVPAEAVAGVWEVSRANHPVRYWPNPRHGAPAEERAAGVAAPPLPPLLAGRRPAGRALLGWLEDARAPRLCRVAGSSGTGRTHLLRWLAAACPPDHPRPDRRVQPVLDAAGLTAESFVWRLGAALGVPAGSAHELVAALTDGTPRVLVVTDLDRAGGGLVRDAPQRIAAEVLRPLLAVPWLRMVVECGAGTPAAEALDVPAAVLDLDRPQWTDPFAFEDWCLTLTEHQLPSDALYPSPALALLAARTAPGVPVDPAAEPGRKAESLAEAWWASLPEEARAPMVALAAVGGGVDAALWAELPTTGGAAAVQAAADFVLPSDDGGRLRVWPYSFADRLTLWGLDHAALRRAVLRARPGPRDADRLGVVLRHAVRSGAAVLDLLADPAVLVHADPAAVTAAFGSFSPAFADATSPDRMSGGPWGVGPERAGDPPRRLIEAWWLAGPVVTASADPQVRASALHTWLAGADDPELADTAARLALTAGHGWRVRWSFARRVDRVYRLAAGHGRDLAGLLMVAAGRTVCAIDPGDGTLVQRADRATLDDPSLAALAVGEDGSRHVLTADGGILSIGAADDPQTVADALVRLRESLEHGATAMAALGRPRPVVVLGDEAGYVHAVPGLPGAEPRRTESAAHRGAVTAVDLTHYENEHLVVSGGADGTVWTWMPDRYPMTDPVLARDAAVTAVAVTSTVHGLMYAAGWADGLVRVVLVGAERVTHDLRFGSPAVGLVVTELGRLCVATADGVLGIDLAETAQPPAGWEPPGAGGVPRAYEGHPYALRGERTDVPAVGPEGTAFCRVACWRDETARPADRYAVTAQGPWGRIERRSGDAFRALRAVSLELEPAGWTLVLAGTRRDVTVDRALAEAGGERAYLMVPVAPGVAPPLVDLLDRAEPAQVGTVEEQRRAAEAWLEANEQALG